MTTLASSRGSAPERAADQLFADARDGDGEALDQLLRLHRDAVTAVCRRRLRSRVDADDAVQETMLRAISSLEAVREPARLQSYLCRIAERVCLDMMRAGSRPMPTTSDVDSADGPEALTIRREEAELVRRTLRALSDRQAQALWMRDALGEGVPAVAESLGVTEGSARVLLTRARKQMRDGWAKVAAVIPGFGLKLPAPMAKLVATTGIGPAILAPAAILIAAALVVPNWGTTPTGPTDVDVPSGSSTPVADVPPPPTADAARTEAVGVATPATAPTSTSTAPAPPPPVRAADEPAAEMRLPTIAGRDVEVDREDPQDDDVTAGDEELLGVGTNVEETLGDLGVEPPPTTDASAELVE